MKGEILWHVEQKKLETWCQENGREELIEEWNENRNSEMLSPKTVTYNTPESVYWKCKAGHEWEGPVVARTLFGRECPVCNAEMKVLPIGTKYGCFTIIGDYTVYEKKLRITKSLNWKEKKKRFSKEKERQIQMWILLIFLIVGLKSIKNGNIISVSENVG